MAAERASSDRPSARTYINSHEIHSDSQCPGGDLFEETAHRTNYIVLIFTHAPDPEEQAKLEALQVQFSGKIPPCTWVARYEPQDLSPLRELPFVISANPFPKSLKLDATLEAKLAGQPSASSSGPPLMSAAAARLLDQAPALAQAASGSDTFHVIISMQEKATQSPKDLIHSLNSQLGIPEEVMGPEVGAVRARLTAQQIRQIQDVDDVKAVHEFGKMKPRNHLARDIVGIQHAEAQFTQFYQQTRLDGDGEVVAVADSGFHDGTLTGNFFGPGKILQLQARSNHVIRDGAGNVLDDRRNETSDEAGHGTHVAATVLGSYQAPNPDPLIKLAGTRIEGAAPGASLVGQVIFGCPPRDPSPPHNRTRELPDVEFGDITDNNVFTGLFNDAYDGTPAVPVTQGNAGSPAVPGARIHSNSWGEDPKHTGYAQLPYGPTSGFLDIVVNNHRDYFIAWAAGNDGDEETWAGTEHIGGLAVAKNVLTVGACYSDQYVSSIAGNTGYEPPATPNGGDVISNESIPAFSSRGPPMNQHADIIKPDVVAPGVAIYSADSAGRLDDIYPIGYPRNHDANCVMLSGTSMATPLVAGGAALLRQALRLHRGMHGNAAPSAALIKALIVNGADDLSRTPFFGWLEEGAYTTTDIIKEAPANEQGFGRVNIQDSIDHVLDNTYCFIRDVHLPDGLQPNGTPPDPNNGTSLDKWESTTNIRPPPQGKDANFKVTLAWTDKEGAGLQNDLYLSVTFPTRQAPGHVIDQIVSMTSTDARLRRMAGNNVQKLAVYAIPFAAVGQTGPLPVRVTVKAGAMTPNATQDYALVWKIWYSDVPDETGLDDLDLGDSDLDGSDLGGSDVNEN